MSRVWKFVQIYLDKIMAENIEYRIFPIHFFLLTLSGLWFPQSAISSNRFLFKIFLSTVIFMSITGSIEIGCHFLNAFDFTSLFFFAVAASGCYKSVRFFQKRKIIISILEEYSNEKLMKSQNHKEKVIDEKCKIEIRFENLQFFTSLAEPLQDSKLSLHDYIKLQASFYSIFHVYGNNIGFMHDYTNSGYKTVYIASSSIFAILGQKFYSFLGHLFTAMHLWICVGSNAFVSG